MNLWAISKNTEAKCKEWFIYLHNSPQLSKFQMFSKMFLFFPNNCDQHSFLSLSLWQWHPWHVNKRRPYSKYRKKCMDKNDDCSGFPSLDFFRIVATVFFGMCTHWNNSHTLSTDCKLQYMKIPYRQWYGKNPNTCKRKSTYHSIDCGRRDHKLDNFYNLVK
jgi:hypothetical protein